MKKAVVFSISIILSIILGFSAMYALIYFYPEAVLKVTEKKNVTITDTGISEGINKIYDAAVVVEAYSKGTLVSTGSGFVFSKNDNSAYVMTNHHVIEDSSEIKVTFLDGTITDAVLKGSDEYADIAVLEIDPSLVKKVAIFGSSEKINLGDTVFTIGAPMGKEYAGTVTRGILSGKNRLVSVSISGGSDDWIMNVMQTDAAINPGNSGGPLCNVNGEVIGINSLKVVESSVEGLGFAIPIEDANKYAEKIIKGEKISRAYIGIEMVNVSESIALRQYNLNIDSTLKEGVAVADIVKESPASKAGVQKNDVIVKVGKNSITSIAELRYYLYKHNPGEKVDFQIFRNNEYITIKITLGEL